MDFKRLFVLILRVLLADGEEWNRFIKKAKDSNISIGILSLLIF
jgi:hypothetical protein